MSTQVSLEPVELAAWTRFLRAHAALTRRLNIDLESSHDLTLNDYEVLLRLAHAPGRKLRRIDLAEQVFLTPSGITRLLEGLERAGFVTRASCESDGRVVYAKLTDAGYRKLKAAAKTHLAGVRALFVERFHEDELGALAELLGRLPALGTEDVECAPAEAAAEAAARA